MLHLPMLHTGSTGQAVHCVPWPDSSKSLYSNDYVIFLNEMFLVQILGKKVKTLALVREPEDLRY